MENKELVHCALFFKDGAQETIMHEPCLYISFIKADPNYSHAGQINPLDVPSEEVAYTKHNFKFNGIHLSHREYDEI